ncbi:MAG: RluA family pseudouridine synthase, partial [Gammaproteobacteria bacterium]|nr:RluA family pseudouridine synthase [Gammaproteobacteria bacterium]
MTAPREDADKEYHAAVPEDAAGLRLDQVLARLFTDFSRSRLKEWIEAGLVTVDGETRRPRDKVAAGAEIMLTAPVEQRTEWAGEELPFTTVYADDDLLVVNKPAGLVTHPGAGNPGATLVNGLLHRYPELALLPRGGILHRLDKDTSGLLIVGRRQAAYENLSRQMRGRTIKRHYLALVNGTLTGGGTVDAPIARHRAQRTRMAVAEGGKPAVTHYRILERFRRHTCLDVALETGRTHQIRVHMAHLGHPLVGDTRYGARPLLPRGAD